jgi:hypothetical protein
MNIDFSQSKYFTVTNILLSELAWSVSNTTVILYYSDSLILFDSRGLLCDEHDLKTALDHDCKLHLYKIKLCYFTIGGDLKKSKKFTSLDFEIGSV